MDIYIKVVNDGSKFECIDVFEIDYKNNKYIFRDQIPISEYINNCGIYYSLIFRYHKIENIKLHLDESISKCDYMIVDEQLDELF